MPSDVLSSAVGGPRDKHSAHEDWGIEFREQLLSHTPNIALSAALLPIHHAKVLMQLGHEPLPLSRGRQFLFFGRECLFLPNVLAYVRNMKQQVGLAGCYTGLDSFLVGALVKAASSIQMTHHLDEAHPDLGGGDLEWSEVMDESQLTDAQSFARARRRIVRSAIAQAAGIVVTRPFVVAMTRQMAQNIGFETKYTHVFGTITTIWREDGAKGLFAGLVPQLVGDIGLLVTLNLVTFAIDRAFVRHKIASDDDDETRTEQTENVAETMLPKAMHAVAGLVVSGWFYPFQCVATCMAVEACGLAAGCGGYNSWLECKTYLTGTGQQRRGASLFMRQYKGPVTYQGNMAYAKPRDPLLVLGKAL